MKNTKIYIFNSASRAAKYGIGTYINQLISCLNKTNLSFEVIYLHGEGTEVAVSEEENYRQISIPNVAFRKARDSDYYYRNVTYLLDEYIPQDKNTEYIFHLNFMSNPQFVSCLRKRYKCKIILVCHYTNWSFSLLGDEKKLLSLVNKTPRKRTSEEKQIYKNVQIDIKMIKKCDRFVCVAQHTLDTFLKISDIDKSKCQVINNALKDEYNEINVIRKPSLKAKWWISEDTKVILFVGRLDEVKGISFLIKAFKNLLETNPETRLMLVGDGDYSRWLKEAENCWTKISFTGRLEEKKIAELYQIADIGVVSSIHEEFGLVALEMMMHKIPIIVGDTGGLSEIVENNVTGLKVPIRIIKEKRILNVKKLTNHLITILHNSDFGEKLAENGRNKFLEKYEITSFREKILTLYKSL
jgi:glycosyltransferase